MIHDRAKQMPVSDETVSYEVEKVPEVIRGLNNNAPSVFAFINRREEYSYIAVHWGDGFKGHWGLNIGSTNFVDYSGEGSEMWKPGVYFWRSYHPGKPSA